jgi:acetylserotonin N-methyltransferase
MNPELPVIDDTPVWDAWLGLYQMPAISVALELDVFESLQEPADTATFAAATGYSVRGLKALLGMLKCLGLLDRRESKWQLTPGSRAYLLRESPFYWGPFFSYMAASLPIHELLLENVRGTGTGEGRPVQGWEDGQVDAELARKLTDFMHCHSIAPAIGLARSCDFSGVKRVLDVGGGSGCYAFSLANANAGMRATVLDLPTICEVAEDYIAKAGVADRVDTTSVDMFRESWPTGYDCHFFANVFHDWSLETCRELAQSSFAALEPGGRICLQEMLLDDSGDGPIQPIAFSVLMCLGTRGQQFTLTELREILERAGFTDIAAERSYGYYSLVTGYKAEGN